MTSLWLIAAGAAAGLGLFLIVAEAVPAPPRIDAALARIDGPAPAAPRGGQSLEAIVGRWMAAHLAGTGGLVIPRTDLALLGRTPEKFLVHKLVAAMAGLASFALFGAFLAVAGLSVPWEVPAAASVAAATGMFFFPDYDVRAEAARRRRDFSQAWISYLQLVRLARAAGAGTSEALEYAARIGNGWAFTRIADVLDAARRAHEPPWTGLAALGEEIGVPQVSELADTAQIAGSEGTKLAATLAAKTESLRNQMLSDVRAQVNSRTTTMIVPLTLLGLGFVLLMAFPPFYTLIFSS
jgi:type II secretion system (T2SS) protein F